LPTPVFEVMAAVVSLRERNCAPAAPCQILGGVS